MESKTQTLAWRRSSSSWVRRTGQDRPAVEEGSPGHTMAMTEQVRVWAQGPTCGGQRAVCLDVDWRAWHHSTSRDSPSPETAGLLRAELALTS